MTVIDVHTHMLTLEWIDMLRRTGGGRYEVKKTKAGQDSVFLDNAPFMTLMPGMWDYGLRIKAMDEAGGGGVMVLANSAGQDLTDPAFAPIWREIDRLGLPVLVHPTAPQGLPAMHM